MDSLTTTPVAEVLERLFAEAEAKDYQGFYRQFARHFLSISPEFGRFLYACTHACNARRIVEFGTSFGVSTIHLASAVRDNGGTVIGTELEASKAARAREHLQAANMADLVDIRIGDALETLREGVGGQIDMVLLDGAISLYRPVLALLEPQLRSNAVVIGENAVEESTDYLDYVRDPSNGYFSLNLPFAPGRGNELSLRTQ